MSAPRYAELQVTSHFSFLRGASSCEELFAQAAMLSIEALAIVDAFLATPWSEAERHQRRIDILAAYEVDHVAPPVPGAPA